MREFSLKCHGVGDGTACPDRDHSAFLYRFGDQRLLLDCGEPISRRLAADGLGGDGVDRIFLSHFHFDHLGGFFMLIQGLWLDGRGKDLPVHLPGEGIEPIRQLLEAGYLFEELLGFRLKFEPLTALRPVEVGAVRVTPFPTTHLRTIRERFGESKSRPFEAFSFLLEADGLRIGHSADLGAPSDLEPLLAEPLDLLVCEMTHFEPEELLRHLKSRAIRQLVLVHVGGRFRDREEEIRSLAARELAGLPVLLPRDGDVVRI
jgi:ribonuclease Z